MRNEISYGNSAFSVVKTVLLSLAVSLLLALIFALVMRLTSIGENAVYAVTQTLKELSLAVGILVFVRGEKGWLQGLISAVLFTATSYLAFSALGGDFSLSWLIFAELAISSAIGAVAGMVAVNLRG